MNKLQSVVARTLTAGQCGTNACCIACYAVLRQRTLLLHWVLHPHLLLTSTPHKWRDLSIQFSGIGTRNNASNYLDNLVRYSSALPLDLLSCPINEATIKEQAQTQVWNSNVLQAESAIQLLRSRGLSLFLEGARPFAAYKRQIDMIEVLRWNGTRIHQNHSCTSHIDDAVMLVSFLAGGLACQMASLPGTNCRPNCVHLDCKLDCPLSG